MLPANESKRGSRLALGTVQFGLPYGIASQAGQVSKLEARTMLRLAAVNGIDTVDTAIAYGESETCLGEIGAQEFMLVTKLPAIPDDCCDIANWIEGQVAASLSRLGVTTVYGLLLHRADQLLGPNGRAIYLALQGMKRSGRVGKIGVSIYAPTELDMLTRLFRIDLVQAPFNLVDRRLLTTGWLQRLKAQGVEVHTRSSFLQGLLLMPKAAIPTRFARWSGLWQRWHRWLAEHDASAVEACLAYPLSMPEIDRVVVGADSAAQLAQIVRAADVHPRVDLPDLQSQDEDLINPTNW